MKSYIQAAILLRELRGIIEGQAQRSRMGLHFDQWRDHPIAVARVSEIRIDDIACVTTGPAVIATVLQSVDRFRRNVVSQQVAPVISGPDLIIPGVDRQPNGVAQPFGIEPPVAAINMVLPDGSALLIRLNADVAG